VCLGSAVPNICSKSKNKKRVSVDCG